MKPDFDWTTNSAVSASLHAARPGRGFRPEQRPGGLKLAKPIYVAIVASLLVATAGCLEPTACPDTHSPAAAHPPEGLGEVHVGQGDPYLPGPVAFRKLTITRCEHGTPVELLILTPKISGAYPVVVFQHGFMALNESYGEVLRQLASHGFVVVAPQMYEPGLAALLGRPTAAEEAATVAQLLDWLPGGLPVVLDYTPALDRVGLAGHSRGGKVAWGVLVADASRAMAIAGIDPVDGTGGPLGTQARIVQGPFNFSLPTLVIGTGLGGSCAPAGDNHEQFYTASVPPAWHIVVPGQGHGDMLDEEAAAAAAWLCPSGPDRMGMRRLTAGLLAAFFRASLQGDAAAYTYLTEISSVPLPIQIETK